MDGPGTDRGVVFQSATLLPWMSVLANVRLALDQVRPGARPADALPYLEAVGLRGQEERYPRELSAVSEMPDRRPLSSSSEGDPR